MSQRDKQQSTIVPADCHRCAYGADLGREIKRLRAWQRAYAKGRAGLVEQADLDHAEVERLRALLTNGNAFWEAIYPHIDECGPDLTLSDCEQITSWLTAALRTEGKP